MTSTPWVPNDVTSLPRILAGPIVRKVTENEVSVWLVLKSGEDLTLKIYDSSGQLVNAVTQTPTQLGDKIFIACLRATNPSSFLSHGQSYGYNIVNSLGEDFFTPDFADETGINALIYASSPTFGSLGKLPSFVLPETNLNKLRIIHGSCRKPHGEGIDALSTLSHMIEDSFLNPTNDRPQMLCLTGDQIYSDDVADALLFMIRKYCPILFNWNETLPLVDDLDDLKPGYRYDHVIDIMNFPTTKE